MCGTRYRPGAVGLRLIAPPIPASFRFQQGNSRFSQIFPLLTSEAKRCAFPAIGGTGGKDPRAYALLPPADLTRCRRLSRGRQ